MEYNDYPENFDDQVVQKLNTEYSNGIEVDVLNNVACDVKEAKIKDLIIAIYSSYDMVIQSLETIVKLDRRHISLLAHHLDIANKQKEVLNSYVSDVQKQNVLQPKNFHMACVSYFKNEINLLRLIGRLCALGKIDTFFDLLITRIDTFDELFDLYTK